MADIRLLVAAALPTLRGSEMSRPATDRLKVNPPLGMMPELQYLQPDLLQVDQSYQRTLDTDASRTLVRGIAQHWNWDLCQPLVVARRDGGTLYVIDGQHRLAAARLRGDIAQLPAVVVQYASAADEAASFVHLNQQRRPLTKIDLFKAALASGDSEATTLLRAVEDARLSIAPHSNYTAWKPGMMSNVGGLEGCLRTRGEAVLRLALKALAEAFAGQILRYCGTVFPGIAAVVAIEIQNGRISPEAWLLMIAMFAGRTQEEWRSAMMAARADDPNLKFARASENVFAERWCAFLQVEAPESALLHRAERALATRAAPTEARASILTDEALDRVFDMLADAADAGAPCPSNIEIEVAIGASSSSMGAKAVDRLEQGGRIHVKRGQRARVVTIVATGRSTSLPAGTKAAPVQVSRNGVERTCESWSDALSPLAKAAARENVAPVPAAKPAAKPEPDRGKAPVINWGKVSAAAGGARGAVFKPDGDGKAWCAQCERRRDRVQIRMCASRFCSFGAKA